MAQSIQVKPSYGLTDEEVERMLLESFEHAEADVEARMLIEVRNEAETVIHATEKSLRNPAFPQLAAADLSAAEVARIEAGLARLKQVISADYCPAIEAATKEYLNQATRHLAEVMMNRSVQAALSLVAGWTRWRPPRPSGRGRGPI